MRSDRNLEIMALIIKTDYGEISWLAAGRVCENLSSFVIVTPVLEVHEKKKSDARAENVTDYYRRPFAERQEERIVGMRVRISGNKGRFIVLGGETSQARSRGC